MFDRKPLNKFDYAFTNLDIEAVGEFLNSDFLYNPLDDKLEIELENRGLREIYLFYNPDYLYFTTKTLLNIELYPLQCVALEILFKYPFPMLIGSRGFSKCSCKDTYIVTQSGIKKIGNILDPDVFEKQTLPDMCLLGENKYTKVDYGWCNGYSTTKYIKTRFAYEFEGTLNHPMRVIRNNNIEWVELQDIKYGDKIVIKRDYEQWNHNNLDPDIAYMLGAIIGDGCYSIKSHAIGFTNIDVECIDNVNKGFMKYKNVSLRQKKSNEVQYYVGNKKFKNDFIKDFGLKSYNGGDSKITPDCIWSAPKISISQYLRGLFDTDGCSPTKTPVVEYSTKSKDLARDVQFLLLTLGIISRIETAFNKKYKKNYYKVRVSGSALRLFHKLVGFSISRKQKILEKHCKKIVNENIDLIPRQLILDDLLKLRELARTDTIFNGKYTDAQIKDISKSRLKSYDLSYDKFNKILSMLSESKNIGNSREYKKLRDIEFKNYFYDTVTEITDGYNQTYDIHLKDDHSFISNGFISHNSFLLAVYLTLRSLLFPGTKAVVAGAAFRQSKYIFEYVKKIWDNAPILQSIYKGKNPYKQLPDIWKFTLGQSEMMFIPIGMGETIRGLRANVLAMDEFNSINLEVYEVVLSQFTSVSMNPIENLKQIAKRKAMLAAGLEVEEEVAKLSYFNNQSIISGTLKFSFDPLAIYWKKYKDLIESKGQRLEEIFGDIGKNLNWRDFAIIRVPYECIPEGFMDDKVVARARATMHTDFYQAEYGCVPISDTTGFFKRSLIEGCTATEKNVLSVNWPPWCSRAFESRIRGEKNRKYVMGIDPASEQDNFCIVILELCGEHQRLVYCWTTTREIFKKQNLGDDKNYYGFCVRKIRNLMKQFAEIVAIGCDSQGGGYAIEEGLHDTDKLMPGEVPIWPIIEEKEKDTDSYAGQHILHMINFASSEWVSNSNHGMKKDMQDKLLLFPQFNAVLLGIASEKDMEEIKFSENPIEDTLENCMLEVESLKDELSIITRTRTLAGRERWDTPEIKVGRNKKDKLRKDRYSALLIANSVARTIHRAPPDIEYNCVGAAVGDRNLNSPSNQMYIGQDWYNVSPNLFRGIVK